MEESILNSIKSRLGIKDPSYDVFDEDILSAINSSFATLYQIGVDSAKQVSITSAEETWEDVFFDDIDLVDLIKDYTFKKVRISFDPPSNSSVLASLEKQSAELEWRIQIQAEGGFDVL